MMTTLQSFAEFAGNAAELCAAVVEASRLHDWPVDPKLNERLVRYYAGEGVIDRPERQGRDSTYGFRHLVQLLMARRLSSEKGWSLQTIAQYNQETATTQLDQSLFKPLQTEEEFLVQAFAGGSVNAELLVQKFKRDASLKINTTSALAMLADQNVTQAQSSSRTSRVNERGTASVKPPMAITDVLDEVKRMKDEWLHEISTFKNMHHSVETLGLQVERQGLRVSEISDAQRRLNSTLEHMAQVGFEREQAFLQHVGQMLERHTFEVKGQLSELAHTQRALERRAVDMNAQLDDFARKQQVLLDLIEKKQKRVADS